LPLLLPPPRSAASAAAAANATAAANAAMAGRCRQPLLLWQISGSAANAAFLTNVFAI